MMIIPNWYKRYLLPYIINLKKDTIVVIDNASLKKSIIAGNPMTQGYLPEDLANSYLYRIFERIEKKFELTNIGKYERFSIYKISGVK